MAEILIALLPWLQRRHALVSLITSELRKLDLETNRDNLLEVRKFFIFHFGFRIS
jgi:hypothetical protein